MQHSHHILPSHIAKYETQSQKDERIKTQTNILSKNPQQKSVK